MSNRHQAPISSRFRIEPRYTSSPKPPGPPVEGWQRIGWWREAREVVTLRRLGDRHVVQYKRAAVRMIEHALPPTSVMT
jgi:hypothetical protein